MRELFDISRRHRMQDPLLLLTSLKVFDQHAGRLAAETVPGSGTMDRLTAMRRRLGFDSPAVGQRFYTTRTLGPGQRLMVWPHGHEAGFVRCVVVGRDERAVTAVPLRRTEDRLLSGLAPGDKVKARFWRDGDTEYRFRTHILEVVEETTTVRLCHAERPERVQLRDYYRIGVNEPIQLYVLPPGIEQVTADNVAARARELCDATLVDLSGGGLAVQVESKLPRHSELVVHPDYAGPFPLAGTQLVQIEQTRQDRHWRARLQFVSLPDSVRDELVAKSGHPWPLKDRGRCGNDQEPSCHRLFRPSLRRCMGICGGASLPLSQLSRCGIRFQGPGHRCVRVSRSQRPRTDDFFGLTWIVAAGLFVVLQKRSVSQATT